MLECRTVSTVSGSVLCFVIQVQNILSFDKSIIFNENVISLIEIIVREGIPLTRDNFVFQSFNVNVSFDMITFSY